MLNFGADLSASQRIEKNVIKLMGHDRYRALASVLMIGTRSVVKSLPPFNTAATNGRDEYYCEEWIETLTDAEVRGVLLHENGHKMYRHLITWQEMHKINFDDANKACDHFLNIRITDDNKQDGFAVLPKGGLCDFKYRGMNEMQIFNTLRKEQKEQGGGGGNGKPEAGNGKPVEKQAGFDSHDWDGAAKLTDEETKELSKEIDEAIRQGALAAGKTGSGGNRDIDELLQPQIMWEEVLREFITETCVGSDYSTWRRPNRRYIAGGLYMPSGVSEHVAELVIGPDMSWSTMCMMPSIMAEVKGICDQVKPELVRILYWDTCVAKEEVYKIDELEAMIKTTRPTGGSGTTVQCVPDYMTEHHIEPQAVIIITDGYLGGDWGKGWNVPILWCVIDNKTCHPSHGKYVHMDSSLIGGGI